MFDYLHVYNTRERLAIGCADQLLAAATAPARWSRSPRGVVPASKILLLRMERIGDLLMAVPAISTLHTRAPDAELHLVVGSWNEKLAGLIPGLTTVETLNPSWLARDEAGATAPELVRRTARWRALGFDLAVNFEPDIRTNGLLALSGAPHRLGYYSGGGGAFLTRALPYDTTAHTAINALRLVDTIYPGGAAKAGDATVQESAYLDVPKEARQEVATRLADVGPVVIGINPSGGRRLKQWDPDRFVQTATRLARAHHATVALIGAPDDRPLVNAVIDALPEDVHVIDFAGQLDLVGLAALCERMTVLITGDTGPLHLAAAVGTATVAIFGPSDPRRYAPLAPTSRVVRTELWCRPCNRIRLPPARCRDRLPDCLAAVSTDDVCRAADELLVAESRDAPTLDSRRP